MEPLETSGRCRNPSGEPVVVDVNPRRVPVQLLRQASAQLPVVLQAQGQKLRHRPQSGRHLAGQLVILELEPYESRAAGETGRDRAVQAVTGGGEHPQLLVAADPLRYRPEKVVAVDLDVS